jgi:hypothetical protein
MCAGPGDSGICSTWRAPWSMWLVPTLVAAEDSITGPLTRLSRRRAKSGLRAALRREEPSALEVSAFGLPRSVIRAAARAGSAPRPAVDSTRVPFGAAVTVATDPAVLGVSGLLGHSAPPTVSRCDATPALMGSQQEHRHPGATRHAVTRHALTPRVLVASTAGRPPRIGGCSSRLTAGARRGPRCSCPCEASARAVTFRAAQAPGDATGPSAMGRPDLRRQPVGVAAGPLAVTRPLSSARAGGEACP